MTEYSKHSGMSPPDEELESQLKSGSSLARAAGSIGAATFLSRVMGFVRDILIAQFFGASLVADAFFVAFAIPSMFRRLLTEGALTSAFIPVYSDERAQRGKHAARRFSGAMGLVIAFALIVICTLGVAFSGQLVMALAPGFTRVAEKFGLTTGLTRVMFPFLFFIGLSAIVTGVLNASRRFFLPALAPVIQNLAMIVALLSAGIHVNIETTVFWLAWSVVIGGALQLLVQIPLLVKLKITPLLSVPWRVQGVGRCIALMGPAAFGAAILQINVLVDRWLASFLEEGSISYLYYANRLVQFPHGILSLAVTAAAFPVLSDRAAQKRHQGEGTPSGRETLIQAGRLTLFITMPATMGLMALAQPIMEVLFERGAFGPDASASSAAALRAYAVGLVFFGIVRLMAAAFHARLDTRYPVRCANWSVLAHIVMSVILMIPFGYVGLALSTSLASVLNGYLLYLGIQQTGDWPGEELGRTAKQLFLASGLMGGIIFVVNELVWPTQAGAITRGAVLLSEVILGGVVFLVSCKWFLPEIFAIWRNVIRRRKPA